MVSKQQNNMTCSMCMTYILSFLTPQEHLEMQKVSRIFYQRWVPVITPITPLASANILIHLEDGA